MEGKRKYTRVPFVINATMEFQGEEISGAVENLSMKGLYVRTAARVPADEELSLCLTLLGTTPKVNFWLRGRIKRIETEGLGFEIVETDLPAFIHLRNIVSMNIEDSDQVLLELQE